MHRVWLPTEGDMVVCASLVAPLFDVGAYREPPVISFSVRADAIELACQQARVGRVNAWYSEDGQKFRPLARHRPD